MEDKMPDDTPTPDNLPIASSPAEPEYEVNQTIVTPFEGDYMEITMEVADNLAKYEKSVDAIMNFIIKRTYPGDWVSHDKVSTPLEERTVNMIGAAAERIARDLGIQESNRTRPTRKMHEQEKHPGHYYYECEGDFTLCGRKVHAVGMASTINPFHLGKAGGDVSKIREEYLVQEAWRDCTKNGIRMWFGLRKIPITKLRELGYDINKVKFVNFSVGKDSASAKNPEATAKPEGAEAPVAEGEKYTLTLESMEANLSKNKKSFYRVKDEEGVTYYAWGDATSDMIKKLLDALANKKPISVMIKGGSYPIIIAVV